MVADGKFGGLKFRIISRLFYVTVNIIVCRILLKCPFNFVITHNSTKVVEMCFIYILLVQTTKTPVAILNFFFNLENFSLIFTVHF
jgi:hypothetical protein